MVDAADDAFDSMMNDMVDGYITGDDDPFESSRSFRRHRKQMKECNSCGEYPLYWHMHNNNWRLHKLDSKTSGYILHVCPTPNTPRKPLFKKEDQDATRRSQSESEDAGSGGT